MKVEFPNGRPMLVPEDYPGIFFLTHLAEAAKNKTFKFMPIRNEVTGMLISVEIREIKESEKPNKNNGSKIASKDKNTPNRPPLTTK